MTECPLCSQAVPVRKIKRHFRVEHQLEKVTRAIVNQLADVDQKVYRALNNKTGRIQCEFCNESFGRISLLLKHLSKTHQISVRAKIALLVDLHIAALKAELNAAQNSEDDYILSSPRKKQHLFNPRSSNQQYPSQCSFQTHPRVFFKHQLNIRKEVITIEPDNRTKNLRQGQKQMEIMGCHHKNRSGYDRVIHGKQS